MLGSLFVNPILLASIKYADFNIWTLIENRLNWEFRQYSWLKIIKKDTFTSILQLNHCYK